MNNIGKTIIFIVSVLIIGLILWYFQNIIAYILASVVLSLMGHPIVSFLRNFEIKGKRLPKSVCAGIALLVLWGFVIGFISFLIPFFAGEARQLSVIDTKMILTNLDEPLKNVESLLYKMHIITGEDGSLKQYLSERLVSILSVSRVSNIFNILTGILGNLFVAIFAITFITFFFLKDNLLFVRSIMVMTPSKHEKAMKNILNSIKNLLIRYFLGLSLDVIVVFILVTLGMTIAGVNFNQAIIIGLFAGLLNMIPYVGPIIAIIFGLAYNLATHLSADFYNVIIPTSGYMLVVYLIVQILDGTLIQPFIFSNSVKAHPLEIFLVIMTAGSIAGITGMLLAIPSYTILRVIAKEFFTNFKVVRKLTEKL